MKTIATAILAGAALLGGCAAQRDSTQAQQGSARSILTRSTPSAGSVVAAPIEELVLHFDPPARLDEVTVSGPGGLMPTKVTAVAEARDYTLPVHGLGPGSYTVEWRAVAAGQEYRGSFGFTVK